MRYHYEKPNRYFSVYGVTHTCNHPVYDRCTLFQSGKRGLAVIQQRYDAKTKHTWWGELDPWLTDDLYLHPRFQEYFNTRAKECSDDMFPTVSVRQLMWSLKMKPMKRQRWETCFDRRDI